MAEPNINENVRESSPGGFAEYIGFTKGETGDLCISAYVIPNLFPELRKQMGIPDHICAVGLISSRFGGAPIVMTLDDVLKCFRSEMLKGEFLIEPMAGGGHGSFFMIGGPDAEDVREVIKRTFDHCLEMYGGIGAGQTACFDLQFSSLVGDAVEMSLPGGIPGESWCQVVAIPKGLGLVTANEAVKNANVRITQVSNPWTDDDFGFGLTGGTADCLAAVRNAREMVSDFVAFVEGEDLVPLGGEYF